MKCQPVFTRSLDNQKIITKQYLGNAFQRANQLTVGGMSHPFAIAPQPLEAARAGAVAPPPLSRGQMLLASILGLGLLLGGAATGYLGPIGLFILAILAVSGVFAFFATLAGYMSLTSTAQLAELGRTALDHTADPAEVLTDDGRVLYRNAAAERRVRDPQGLVDALSREPDAQGAIFRLMRAARQQVARSEEIVLNYATRPELAGAVFLVRVSPLPRSYRSSSRGQIALWSFIDMTEERRRNETTIRTLDGQLGAFERLPVGVLTVGREGHVGLINQTLATWVGLKAELGADGRSKAPLPTLAEVLPADAAQHIRSAVAQGLADLEFDTELVREDASVMPVRLIARNSGDVMTVLVVDRRASMAEHGPGTSNQALTQSFDTAPIGIAVLDAEGRIARANHTFGRMFSRALPALGGSLPALERPDATQLLSDGCNQDDRNTIGAALRRAVSGRPLSGPIDAVFGEKRESARRIYAFPHVTHADDPSQDQMAAIIYVIDTSEHKELERRFAHSQKMEALGTFVGQIAHDFNNVLQVIIPVSEMLLFNRKPTDPSHAQLNQIKSSGLRAAEMVRKLLAFSRQQTLAPVVLDLNEAIEDYGFMLNRWLGEKVELKRTSARDLWLVKADVTEFERVLMNLVRNANDAMPDGGTITISTRNVPERESLRLATFNVTPGEYVLIKVDDTGTGMPANVLERIFDPYFSTKEVGKGTGLGLSTVHGIVKQSQGYIFCDSEEGKGTSFRIYLPRYIPQADEETHGKRREKKKVEAPRDLTGTGRVLIVEDEDGPRSIAVATLKRLGYETIEATTGAEALEILADDPKPVSLI
ncbi:MAG: hypothetical protein RL291_839, partial [Pseudomonadota bacterium]